jgi:LacI family transcriptional regulator
MLYNANDTNTVVFDNKDTMPVTIKQVAARAGVSPMTVSRVLNNSPLVTHVTRDRVLQVMEELGYAPNLLARSLVQRQSPIIGLIVTELANPFFAPIISAIQEVVRQHGYFVLIGDSERQPELQANYLGQFQQVQVGGLLITPLTRDTAALAAMRDSGTPVVALARRWEEGDFVTADNYAGGKMVAEHLIRLGHKLIACVSLDEPDHTAITDRIAGFKDAFSAAGLEASDNPQLLSNSLRVEDGGRAAETFLSLSPRPTAAFVIADRLAIGFVDRLLARGVRIPEDVAVVGYDDIRYSAYLSVPLTTVSLPKQNIGRLAAEILFERLEHRDGKHEWRQVLLEPELIIRSSCGGHSRAAGM